MHRDINLLLIYLMLKNPLFVMKKRAFTLILGRMFHSAEYERNNKYYLLYTLNTVC